MHGVLFGKCREGATLKTSKKGHAYIQIPLLVPNGRDLLGYARGMSFSMVSRTEGSPFAPTQITRKQIMLD
jgi:hypothetical protein